MATSYPSFFTRYGQTTIRCRPTSVIKTPTKSCPLCKQAGRQHQHYLSKCPYLPIEDKQYISHSRQVLGTEPEELSSDYEVEATPEDSHSYRVKCSTTNRVSVKQSPHLKAFFDYHPLLLTLDIGAETSMIKTSVAKEIGASTQITTQKALQADGVTQLKVVGEVHLTLSRSNLSLHLDALVVDNLDVDVLAGTPFMVTNDISLRPAKQQVTVQGHEISYYHRRTGNIFGGGGADSILPNFKDEFNGQTKCPMDIFLSIGPIAYWNIKWTLERVHWVFWIHWIQWSTAMSNGHLNVKWPCWPRYPGH